MTEDPWPQSLTKAQGSAIRHYREKVGLKHDDLARRLTDAGLPMQRTTLINIEQGRRKALSVPEVLTLGYVLGVPPAMLMIPLGLETTVEPIKGQYLDAWRALAWVSGELGFGHEMRPDNSVARTIGQEIRSNYTAVQELVEQLCDSLLVLELAEQQPVLKEARLRAKSQSEMLKQYLDIIEKKGLPLPQLPADVLDAYPSLSSFYDG